jgi:hypothetical protein
VRVFIGGTPTGTLAHITRAEFRAHCGMLVSWRDRAHPRHAVRLGAPWGMDNFAFTGFDPVAFRRALVSYSGVPGCKFTVAPDVVADAQATARRFGEWHDEIKAHGYPIALAAQDGLETLEVPWRDLDAIFIGGSTEFHFSDFARELTHEAQRRGKWVHMGRVNSARRWNYAHAIGCDSVDGTGVVIERRRILEAMPILRNRQSYMWGATA